MSKTQIQLHLTSNQFEWELSDDKCCVIFMDYSEFGNEMEMDLHLDAECFKKEKYEYARGSFDPCDIQSVGNLCINELDSDEVCDEWDDSEILEVFHNNIDKINLVSC